MKTDKIQIEWLKALQKDPNKVAIEEGFDSFIVLMNGVVAYRLSEDDRLVNPMGAQTTTMLSRVLDNPAATHLLQPTDRYRVGGGVRMYLYDEDPDRPVYVNVKNLANFEEPQLYMPSYDPTGAIVVREYDMISDAYKPVGIVMPVRVKPDDNEDNEDNEY